MLQHPAQRRRNRPRPGADLDDLPVGVVLHHHAARVARQPLRRYRGNAPAIFQDRLAGLVRIGQHRGIHMDDDLVAVARRPGIEIVLQRRLRDHSDRLGALLVG
jgi:hypothetical protein